MKNATTGHDRVTARVCELANGGLGPDQLERWVAFYRSGRNTVYDRETRLAIADRLAEIVWLERLAESEGKS